MLSDLRTLELTRSIIQGKLYCMRVGIQKNVFSSTTLIPPPIHIYMFRLQIPYAINRRRTIPAVMCTRYYLCVVIPVSNISETDQLNEI